MIDLLYIVCSLSYHNVMSSQCIANFNDRPPLVCSLSYHNVMFSQCSADFDDRPPLVSSFSLSEAEENEYLQKQQSLEKNEVFYFHRNI